MFDDGQMGTATKIMKERIEKINKNNGYNGDVEFIVKEDKGIVVCKIWDCKRIPLVRIKKYSSQKVRIFDQKFNRYLINDVYVGVAKCNPDDTFDVETGKKIALNRAKRNRGIAVNNALKKYVKDMQRELATLEQYGIHQVPGKDEV